MVHWHSLASKVFSSPLALRSRALLEEDGPNSSIEHIHISACSVVSPKNAKSAESPGKSRGRKQPAMEAGKVSSDAQPPQCCEKQFEKVQEAFWASWLF